LESALAFMKRGELVPDSIVLDMVSERIKCLTCPGGFLLDGFPRTVAQAEALDAMLKKQEVFLEAVLSYELPIEQVVTRLGGRRTCPGCKAVFHVTARPPKTPGVCDHCGGKLYQREDDRPEAIRVRMEAYERSTAPLIEYYRGKGLLVPISADGAPEEIYQRSVVSLNARSVAGQERNGKRSAR
jgi:adenylate kinase